MKTSVIRAVMRRDLHSFFAKPVGYVFIILFVLGAASALVFSPKFFAVNLANLDTLNEWYPWLLLFFVPAITMGIWSNERAHGTQELLFTLPARDSELLLGKYLAVLGIYTVALLFKLMLPVCLTLLGSPDWGQVFANFLGYWLLGGMLIAVAMLGSQLTDNLAVAFIVGALFCGLLLGSGWAMRLLAPEAATTWIVNGPLGQFGEFARGVVPVSGLVLFAGMAAAFLLLNLLLLSRRNWRDAEPSLHGSLRFVALFVGSVAATALAVHVLPRFDTTVEQIHSLSTETGRILDGLDSKRPVVVTAYVSDNVPEELVQQKRTLLNLLDGYDARGGSAVEKRIVVTEPYSKEARDAKDNYGIEAVQAPNATADFEGGIFLGFVVQSGQDEVVVPFLEPGMSVEYELTRAIRTAAAGARHRIGVLRTDVELNGGFDMQTYRPKPRWLIVDELKQQYEVVNLDPAKDYLEQLNPVEDDSASKEPKLHKQIDALVVPQPSSLPQEDMDRLRDWIAKGNPTLLIEDPQPVSAPGTAATDPKGGQQNMFGGPQPGQKGDLAGLLGAFGVSLSTYDLVWDTSYRNFPILQDPMPEWLFVTDKGIDQRDPVTEGLTRLVLMWAGSLREQQKPDYKFTALLHTASATGDSGTVSKMELFRFAFPGQQPQMNPDARRTARSGEQVLAARIDGPAPPAPKEGESTGKPVKLIVCADLDAFSNTFFQIERSVREPNMQFDNVTFILNCIDSLAGDDGLIALRKRKPKLRELTAVLEAQKQFDDKWLQQRDAALEQAKTQTDAANQRLQAAVDKIEQNTELDERAKAVQKEAVRNAEQARLDLVSAQIDDDKRESIEIARSEMRASKRQVQNQYRAMTILLSIVPALLMGLLVWVRRKSREAQIVPGNRKVHGGAA